MSNVRAFDDVEYQRRLASLGDIERSLIEHDLPADPATALAVLVVTERGVETHDEYQRPAGLRPAEVSDVAALLDSYGVGPAGDTAVLSVASELRAVVPDGSPTEYLGGQAEAEVRSWQAPTEEGA